ncbi:MAG: hypothetical protein ACRENE_06375 [Polyangiaceae bacterium]
MPRRFRDVALLNAAVGIPSRYEPARFARRLDVATYFLDFYYVMGQRPDAVLGDIDRIRRTRELRFEDKTLLLAAGGLDPHGPALLRLAKQFGRHRVFFELWNGPGEIVELAREKPDELYFFPVSAHLNMGWTAKPVTAPANRNVFVSLGGDDDLDLIREVIRKRRDLRFYVPDRSWKKEASVRREFPVHMDEPNATPVWCLPATGSDGRSDSLTWAYRRAYAWCDTVLVITRSAKLRQMRGGIRVADAIRSRKRLVLTHNPMCELLMADHERTCLVAESSVTSVSDALDRILDGRFRIDEVLFEAMRALMTDGAKLGWMMSAGRHASAARRSPFWRDPAALGDRLRTLPFEEVGALPLEVLFGLHRGQRLAVGDFDVRVDDITQSGQTTFDVSLSIAGSRRLDIVLSTAPAERYFRRTGRGHFLGYRGTDVTPDEARALDRVAEHL